MSPVATAASFTAWVRPHWEHMDRLARRLVGAAAAEDVVQEALAAAWRSRARFDAERGGPRAWLLAIVVNKAKDHVRGSLQHAELIDASASDDSASAVAGLDLTAALARLTQRRRVAVALHYYLGLSVDEAAEVMGCSSGTVKSTLSDARRQLRDILGKEYR